MPPDPLVLDAIAGLVDHFGRRWHGYELHGVEHIPRDRASLLVLYHGLVPICGWFLAARLAATTGCSCGRSPAERVKR